MGMTSLTTGMTGTQFRTAFNNNFKRTNVIVYNVEDYGAVHNGVTDDTVAIQTAINACDTAGGGDVYFPNGVYIIGGALQNDVGIHAIDYNSQLYIPEHGHSLGNAIRLIGESFSWMNSYFENAGVILKSTIAGTGTDPSVICHLSWGASKIAYAQVEIENITIIVNAFEETTGVSMCGINLAYSSTAYVNNVFVTIDCARDICIEPETVVFGMAIGIKQDDFPRIGFYACYYGFTYGLVVGEGVQAINIEIYGCKYGIMSLSNNYGALISYAMIHWCKYLIAGHIGTIFGYEAYGQARLKIDLLVSEKSYEGDGFSPAWLVETDIIYDPDNILAGNMDYHRVGGASLIKANGGVNFHTRNLGNGSGAFHWTTAARPTVVPAVGYNTTTGKMEALDGTGWHDLY